MEKILVEVAVIAVVVVAVVVVVLVAVVVVVVVVVTIKEALVVLVQRSRLQVNPPLYCGISPIDVIRLFKRRSLLFR